VKIKKINCFDSINVADVKYSPKYVMCCAGLPQPVFGSFMVSFV
jgi:hypothetical protein